MCFVVHHDLRMPARPEVGAQIRRARQLLDMRQQDLADKLGVSRNTVDSWENDRAYPQRKLARLEQVLGVTLDAEARPPGPFDDLYPLQEEWEEAFLADPALSAETKRQWITDSRRARAAHEARKQPRTDRSLRDPGRAAG